MKNKDILIIGCGAIAHEVREIIELNNWDNVRLQCLNAEICRYIGELDKAWYVGCQVRVTYSRSGRACAIP